MHACSLFLAAALSAPSAASPSGGTQSSAVLFPFFRGNGEEGVFLAVSEDGLHFREANFGRPIFTPPQWEGGQHLTRDPSIVYADGLFHMVWTSNWTGDVFGHASSPDLVHWSEPTQVRPFGDEAQPKNIWAPEVHYDPVRGGFFVVFSSTLPEELGDNDRSGDPHGNDHRPFIVRTTDFQTFTEAEVFFDPGYSAIDPHLVFDDRGTPGESDDRWVMAFKNEMGPDRGGKNLRLAFRDPAMREPWEVVDQPIVGPGASVGGGKWAEGPALLRDGSRWLIYWDSYGDGHYSVAESANLADWTDRTEDLVMPGGHPRHGTPFRVDRSVVAVPMPAAAGTPVPRGIPNAAFEQGGPDAPHHWSPMTWAGGGEQSYLTTGGRGGGACVQISSADGGDLAWSAYAPVEPNTRYRLSGWIRTEGVDAGSGRGAMLDAYGVEGSATEPVTGTAGWTRVASEFGSGDRRWVQINCVLGGWGQSSGTAWYDDVRLEPVGDRADSGSGARD